MHFKILKIVCARASCRRRLDAPGVLWRPREHQGTRCAMTRGDGSFLRRKRAHDRSEISHRLPW
eukprot:108805-Prymnesium_polylepis.1